MSAATSSSFFCGLGFVYRRLPQTAVGVTDNQDYDVTLTGDEGTLGSPPAFGGERIYMFHGNGQTREDGHVG